MPSLATICTGFDGVGVGAKAAGIEVAWGLEYDAATAEVAHTNLGHKVYVHDLLDCDPFDFDVTDILHASPPCTSSSQANPNAGETDLDRRIARKVAAFISTLLPNVFTLENVWAYRNTDSWGFIERTLYSKGYWVDVQHVNSADMGVPQTRKRMIVRAVRGGFVPYLSSPVPWVGWYAAVEDLLDTLPESQFAPWQLARLPELLRTTSVGSGGFGGTITMAAKGRPAFTVTANENQLAVRALLMAGAGNSNLEEARPGKGCRYEDEPAHTVTAISGGTMPKAWLVPGQDFTQARTSDEPSYTVSATELKHLSRGLLDTSRIVAMTARALARFQSIPDWYQLPDNTRLAAKGIGNAVPPLLYQRVIESLVGSLS